MVAPGHKEHSGRFPGPNCAILLPLPAIFMEGMISGVMEADRDERWEKARGRMIERLLVRTVSKSDGVYGWMARG